MIFFEDKNSIWGGVLSKFISPYHPPYNKTAIGFPMAVLYIIRIMSD